MPRYYFNVIIGTKLIDDPGGMICGNDNTARLRAQVIAQHIADTELSQNIKSVAVLNEDSQEIFRIFVPIQSMAQKDEL